MNYENEIYLVKSEKKEINKRSKIKQEEVEEKFIQRKRKCQTLTKNKTVSDNEDEYLKNDPKPNSKRKAKKGMMEYVVPLRIPFKSAQCYVNLIDKVITRYDPLQILRGYRNKLKKFSQFNDFSTRRVEKFLNVKINIETLESNTVVFIDFNSKYFDLIVLNLKANILQDNRIKAEPIQNGSNVSSDKIPYQIEEKIKGDSKSKSNLSEKIEDISESKMSNDLFEKNSEEVKVTQDKSIQPNSENSSNNVNLNLLSDIYYEEIERKYKDQIISVNEVTNIDVLRYKVEMNYYTTVNDFVEDIKHMFRYIYNNLDNLLIISEEKDRTEATYNVDYGLLAKIYLTSVFIEIIKLIEETRNSFKNLYDNDIKLLLENNKLPRVNFTEFKNVPIKKEYQEIKEYEHIFPDVTKSKTASCILPKCDGDCCESFENLGPLNLEKSRWDSKCNDRMSNIECIPDICGCDANKCKNMAIIKRTNKILGHDVIEKYSWGIDLYTYRNLIEFLPLNFSDDFKSQKFIEKTLIRACCDLDIKGYSIKKACELILHTYNSNEKEESFENYFASHLLKVFKNSKIAKKTSSHTYSKGIGIFCLRQEGIKKNELIAPYLGEIYPPWYWYEKQDLIKKNKLDKVLPDFYNIMLERHKSDIRGYDLVMVDPNSKGNFASRMSHSCHPNCNTVLMSSGTEYTIGMYATKDISLGEELTFDYNSVTEKEKEFQDAICLCSSFNCRGHYLIYSNSNLFTEMLSEYHTFLHRNSILVQACDFNFEKNSCEELIELDMNLLDKYAIRSSILENAPFWLKKWAALILRFVDFEAKQLPIILAKNAQKENEYIHTNSLGKEKDMLFDELNESNIEITTGNKINGLIIYDSNDISKKDETNNTRSRSILKDNSSKRNNKKFDFNSNFIFFDGVKKYESSRRRQINNNNESREKGSYDQDDIQNLEEDMNNNESNCVDEIEKKEIVSKEQIEKETKAVEIIFNEIDIEDSKNTYKIHSNNSNDLKIIKYPIIRNSHFNTSNCELMNEDNHQYIIQETKEKIDVEVKPLHFNTQDNPIVKPSASIEDSNTNLKEYINQVAGITENRIQNLAITMDKVNHVLKLMKTNKPPLVIICHKEVYEHYWGIKDSIRDNLCQNFKKILKCHDFRSISSELTSNIENIINILEINYIKMRQTTTNDYELFNTHIRENLKRISIICRNCIKLDKSNKFIFYEGLADILHLYGSTEVYFKHDNSYEKGAESELSFIRRRDISTTSTGDNLDEAIHKDRKYYDKLYIWGQLVGWYKQTVDKPNASLSAERRGTLSYPEVDSFFVSFDNFGKKAKNELFKYPMNSRKAFYGKILENPSQMWPVGNLWSYKNKKKIYGTVQFDSINLSRNPFDINEMKSHIIQTFKSMNHTNHS